MIRPRHSGVVLLYYQDISFPMLAKKYRLKHKRDVKTVFDEGRGISGTFFFIKYWRIDESQYPKRGYKVDDLRFAVVVGKKVSKLAVRRNRLKRRMRYVIHEALPGLKPGYHLVISAKPAALEAPYENLSVELSRLLRNVCL